MTRHVVQFRFPSGKVLYSGYTDAVGGYGWAEKPETAIVYNDAAKAARVTNSAYGATAEYAHVMVWHPNDSLQDIEGRPEQGGADADSGDKGKRASGVHGRRRR